MGKAKPEITSYKEWGSRNGFSVAERDDATYEGEQADPYLNITGWYLNIDGVFVEFYGNTPSRRHPKGYKMMTMRHKDRFYFTTEEAFLLPNRRSWIMSAAAFIRRVKKEYDLC